MHSSALLNLEKFFDIYLKKFENPTIIDFGGRAINDHKSAKDILKKYNIKYKYICVDIENGEGVDLCIKDSYNITEIENNSADIIISTSTFEHIELFWLSYLEIIKILKPKGLFYFNAPSNGDFHRYPKDCWRYYPDSANALIKWAKYNNFNPILLECFTSKQILECGWNDYVSVTLKDKKFYNNFNERIIEKSKDYFNGMKDSERILNFSNKTEDQNNWGFRLWYRIRKKIDKIIYKNNQLLKSKKN